MTLPNDITRCHDDSCQSRERCLRWVEHESGSSHAGSLREPGGYCLSYIQSPRQSSIPVPDGIAPEHIDLYRNAWLRGWIEGWNACAAEPDDA